MGSSPTARAFTFRTMLKWVQAFIEPYINELKKVEWPGWDELYANTVTVLVSSFLLAVLIAVMDFVFQFLVGGLYQIFGS